MPKKYRRKSSRGKKSVLKPGLIVTFLFALGLLMIWKSYMVKDYYSKTRALEKQKGELISEMDELKARLMDLKSISRVGEEVKRFGLTQKVSGRMTIKFRKTDDDTQNRNSFVTMDQVADWLEDAVFKSGQVTAQEKEK